ncbi:hypothetical protein Cflav_PD4479 [Pedosphaera parvula Ellin514]|uniref:Uncharacterized protein n=1 Tax=Pedosphaera parvula (strain Ellin514) TaxID=320771 RepID=B9XFU4_PEDPL|nr:hypothetical protein Cflav_PD4479 [Pedosphaera parvula Ellin514]
MAEAAVLMIEPQLKLTKLYATALFLKESLIIQ